MTNRHTLASWKNCPWIVIVVIAVGSVSSLADSALARGPYQLADLKALERAFVKLADDVRPSVVAVRTYVFIGRENRSRVSRRSFSQGSGFVLSADGDIGTNYHVIEDSDAVTVTLSDGSTHDARVVSADRRRDLAVLHIDVRGLKPVRFADLSKVKPNQWSFAAGNPFGLANRDGNTSISWGTVTALGREMTGALVGNSQTEYYGNLIETSSAINPGNSGGPLFNLNGELIGVVTAIETSSGVNEGAGFAIPANEDTLRILRTLQAGEKVRYGFLGVQVAPAPVQTSRRVAKSVAVRGAQISNISPPDGPAGRAGLAEGDIVIAVDGQPVKDPDELVRLIQYKPVGSTTTLTYLRGQVKRTAKVTLGDRDRLLQATARE